VSSANGLKVAFIAGTLSLGGAEKQMYLMAKTLVNNNAEVRVFAFSRGEYYEQQLIHLGVKCVNLVGNRYWRIIRLFWELFLWKPKILHAVHGFTSPYAGLSGRLLGIKSFGSIRSSVEFFKQHKQIGLLRLIGSLPHFVIFNSKAAFNQAISEKWVTKYKAKLLLNVHQFVEPRPQRKWEKPVVMFLGKLHKEKGVFDLIESLNCLSTDDLSKISECILIGGGPEELNLKNKIITSGLDKRLMITFSGPQSNQMIPSLLKSGDILLFTSHSEGFPNVILEAMMTGMAIVATKVGDIPRIIEDGVEGLLVTPKAPVEFAKSIKYLLDNPGCITEMGAAAYQKAQSHFNYQNLYDNLLEVYDL